MKENVIKSKTFDFALSTIQLYKTVSTSKKEYLLSKQVLRSGTAIGALVREAEQAESKADFIHKLAIAQKEANETDYWLELLVKSDYIDESLFQSLQTEIYQIKKILSSIIVTTKQRIGKS